MTLGKERVAVGLAVGVVLALGAALCGGLMLPVSGPIRLPVLPLPSGSAPEEASRVHLVLLDVDDAPVADVKVRFAGQQGRTDPQGRVEFSGIEWGQHDLGLPVGLRARGAVDVYERDVVRVVQVFEVCPGEIAVGLEDGTPASGAWLQLGPGDGGASILTLDEAGVVYAPDRPCGRVPVDVQFDDRSVLTRYVDVVGTRRVELVLPADREATLWVTDAAGTPLDATLEPVDDVAELEPGHFLVTAPRGSALVEAHASGYEVTQVSVPLDGGEHHAVLAELREVHVAVRGHGPAKLRCGDQGMASWASECAPDPTGWTCGCPARRACLYAPYGGVGKRVFVHLLSCFADDVTEVTLEADAALGAVVGRWTGPQPCQASVPFVADGTCESDGRFRVELRPGTWTLDVGSWPEAQATLHASVGPGVTVDLGDVAPDEGIAFGDILADFPLDDARLVSADGYAELEPDGSFSVTNLPRGASAHVRLGTGDRGSFETFVSEGKVTPWVIAWASDAVGLSAPLDTEAGTEAGTAAQ